MNLVNKNRKGFINIEVNKYLDPTEDWFFDVSFCHKNGNIKQKYTITKEDLDEWLKEFNLAGWENEFENEKE